MRKCAALLALAPVLGGCAGLNFYDHKRPHTLSYYTTKPYLFVQTDKNCTTTAQVIGVPYHEKYIGMRSGWGSAALSVGFNDNGTLKTIGQTTDIKGPETLTAVAGLAAKLGLSAALLGGRTVQSKKPGTVTSCTPSARFYAIKNGVPDGKVTDFHVGQFAIHKQATNNGNGKGDKKNRS